MPPLDGSSVNAERAARIEAAGVIGGVIEALVLDTPHIVLPADHADCPTEGCILPQHSAEQTCRPRARYPHARCSRVGNHDSHAWGDPAHWCEPCPCDQFCESRDRCDAAATESTAHAEEVRTDG